MEAKLRYLKLGEGQQSGMRAEPSSPMPVPFVPDVAPKTAGTTSTSSSESSCSGRSSLSSSERGSAAMDWRPIPRERAPPLAENLKGLSLGDRATGSPDKYIHATSLLDKVREKMDSAKLGHRSGLRLENWSRYGFHRSFEELQRGHVARIKEINRRHMECVRAGRKPPQNQVSSGIDRVHFSELSREQFQERYLKAEKPVIITGLCDRWPAMRNWRLDSLFSGRYRNCRLKVGEDDDGNSIRVKLKYFLNYLAFNQDDSPMYLFDCSFDERDTIAGLIDDYEVPFYFRDDLFQFVSEKRRPPYRWFLIGPQRSGTSAHIDPLATSAWNALVYGRKRWIMTRPGARKRHVKGAKLRREGEDGEAATYFSYVLPRILRQEAEKKVRDMGIHEVIQEPGEVIFVPGGWYHAVLNLTHTVAVTQNFCAPAMFPKVWRSARKGRKHMSRRWLETLKVKRPALADVALKVNHDDGFEFKFSTKKKKKKRRSTSPPPQEHEKRPKI